jgi:hypothetical protein
MEVEPLVAYTLLLQDLYQLREFLADPVLGPFFVDQINEALAFVILTSLVYVPFCGLYRACEIRVDYDRRAPLKIRLHAPLEWNRPPDLDVRCNQKVLSFVVFNAKYMLSFDEICSVSFPVKAAHKESSAWSTTIFS